MESPQKSGRIFSLTPSHEIGNILSPGLVSWKQEITMGKQKKHEARLIGDQKINKSMKWNTLEYRQTDSDLRTYWDIISNSKNWNIKSSWEFTTFLPNFLLEFFSEMKGTLEVINIQLILTYGLSDRQMTYTPSEL